jgi:hypothetical protein
MQADRDPITMVITVFKKNGEPVNVWAEMDTGSFENLVSTTFLKMLDREDEVNMRAEETIKNISTEYVPKGDISLKYHAGNFHPGKERRTFESNFVLTEDDDITILFGHPTLFHQLHALTIDPEYATKAPADLEMHGQPPASNRVDKLYIAPKKK